MSRAYLYTPYIGPLLFSAPFLFALLVFAWKHRQESAV